MNRTLLWILLVLLTPYRPFGAVIISKPECGPPFTCPDHCSIHWEGACPSECRCNVVHDKCEEITCPADPPVCIVYMKHDGCQDCACQSPFRLTFIKNRASAVSPGNITVLSTSTTTTSNTTLTPPPATTSGLTSPKTSIVPGLISEPGIPPQSPSHGEDDLKCSDAQKQEIYRNFAAMDAEAAEIGRLSASSLLFPPVFAYTKFELKKRCKLYKHAYAKTSFAAKRNCFNDYDVYIRTYYAYSYACGFGTESYFYRYFDCLQSLRFSNKVAACQYEYKPKNLADRRGVCVTYNNLMRCVQKTVVRSCGWRGWEVFLDYLNINAKSFSRSCRLKKSGNPGDEAKIKISDDITAAVDKSFKMS